MGACDKTTSVTPVTDLKPPTTTSVKKGLDPIPPVVPKPKVPPDKVTPIVIKASLQNPNQKQTDSSNTLPPPVFYVIVGCGPAAVINHTTLLQSDFGKKRIHQDPKLGEIPVLHIGFRNPWSWYFAHGMGQPNYLLGLPGFHKGNQPGSPGCNEMKDEGLKSVVFGACVDREMDWCLDQETPRWRFPEVNRLELAGWPVMNGCVMWIQKRGTGAVPGNAVAITKEKIDGGPIKAALETALNEDYPGYAVGVAPYRLAVVATDSNGEASVKLVYAQYIDLCTGSGRPRQARAEGEFDAARLEPWRDPAGWQAGPAGKRRIAVATEAIRQEFTWPKNQRVCIANGGAIGLNAAERARDEQCWADWFHNGSLLGTPQVKTFANPRNFSFLRKKNGLGPRAPNEDGPIKDVDLIACDPRIRMGRLGEVKTTTPTCDITLKKGTPRDALPGTEHDEPLIRDYYGNECNLNLAAGYWEASSATSSAYASEYLKARGEALPSLSYDYLILHAGLDTADLGQPGNIVAEKLNPKPDASRGMTCLQSGDTFIRVLGAAAQAAVPQGISNTGDTDPDKMWKYRLTLPISAVPDGFILSGILIATANELFAKKPNRNVNTMTLEGIEKALEDAGLGYLIEDTANKILKARCLNNGYSDVDDMIAKVANFPVLEAKSTTKENELQRIDDEKKAKLERLKTADDVQFKQDTGMTKDEYAKLVESNAAAESNLWTTNEKGQVARLVGKAEIEAGLRRQTLEARKPEFEQAFDFSYSGVEAT